MTQRYDNSAKGAQRLELTLRNIVNDMSLGTCPLYSGQQRRVWSDHHPGPYNLIAALPPNLVCQILDLEFVEMADIVVDDKLANASRLPMPAHPAITDISITSLSWLPSYPHPPPSRTT